MKLKKRNWLIAFLFVVGLPGLYAQTFLNVKEKSGTQTSFALSEINKLIFESGNMAVIKKSAYSSGFGVIDIRYLDFTNITSNGKVVDAMHNKIRLYPNPVTDLLQIQYESAEAETVLIQIVDLQGKILFQQTIANKSGTNNVYIPFNSFQKGLYLCSLYHRNKLETGKVVKL